MDTTHPGIPLPELKNIYHMVDDTDLIEKLYGPAKYWKETADFATHRHQVLCIKALVSGGLIAEALNKLDVLYAMMTHESRR